MKEIAISIERATQPVGSVCRYIAAVKSGKFCYQLQVDNIDVFLDVISGFFPLVRANVVKLSLSSDANWSMTTSVDDEVVDMLFAHLPAPTRVVRFTHTVLNSSGEYQLKCIPCGGLEAPEVSSMHHYPSLEMLEANLKEKGVVYPGGKIDPGCPVIVNASALKELGFDIRNSCNITRLRIVPDNVNEAKCPVTFLRPTVTGEWRRRSSPCDNSLLSKLLKDNLEYQLLARIDAHKAPKNSSL